MLVTLDAPYADTTAADLCFALDLAEQPALSCPQSGELVRTATTVRVK